MSEGTIRGASLVRLALAAVRRHLPRRFEPASPVIPPVPPSVPPVHVERRDLCLADLKPEELRALISELNERSEEVGCVVFRPPGEHACVATIFAGNLERFFMLAAARELRCPVIYIQDTLSWWYQGSTLLPALDELCRMVIVPETGTARALLFGQSSGAYAALAASVWLGGSTVVACAPQTFSDGRLKDRIRFVGVRALKTPDDLIDLRDRLGAQLDPEAMRAVVIAAGELDNPAHAHWWGDYLHMLRLAEVPGIELFVVNANTHVLAHGRINQFAGLLNELSCSITYNVSVKNDIVMQFLQKEFFKSL